MGLALSVAAVLVSIVSNYLTVYRWHLGHDYLALGTSLSAFVNFGLLMLAMRSVAKGVRGRDLTVNMLKLLASCVGLAAVCWAGKATVLKDFHEHTLLWQISALFVTIGVAAGVYFGMNALLRNEEMADFSAILRRKLGRK